MAAPRIAKSNPLLDGDFVNAFVDGVKTTLGMTANTAVTMDSPFVDEDFHHKGDVAGVVGLVNGDMKAKVTISFSKTAALRMVNGMLGETKTVIDREVTDAVGEMTNQIYGTAKTALNQMGYRFEMAIPTVITGSFTMSSGVQTKAIVVPFKMADGEELFVALSVPQD